jgi:hypothetical protein
MMPPFAPQEPLAPIPRIPEEAIVPDDETWPDADDREFEPETESPEAELEVFEESADANPN